MAFVINNGEGFLHRNEKRETVKHPEFTGNLVTPGGEKYDVAAYVNEAKSGKKYFKLYIKEPFQAEKKKEAQPDFDDSDIPF